jgi:ubiquinone/menaquinone biosynthesis C-methylase UbiE
MIETFKKIIRKSVFYQPVEEKDSEEAYNLWSEKYDGQHGNLMLDLDEQVFSGLLGGVELNEKDVADIGCGTGRHWQKILEHWPKSLAGFDVSPGMLARLREKFPAAVTHKITDNYFSEIPDASFDIIVSTLTVAHIENIDEALQAWCRMLKDKGDMIITDFHPDALAFGGKRTFEHNHVHLAVKNFVHSVAAIEAVLLKYDLHIVNSDERIVDERVRHYYAAKDALPVYERFKHKKIIYGIHVRRGYNGIK